MPATPENFESCVSGWLRLKPFPFPYPYPSPDLGMRRLEVHSSITVSY